MISPEQYAEYRAKNIAFIKAMLDGVGCRPVLFLGSGISRRYIEGPSWLELLRIIAEKVGIEAEQFTYMSQKAGGDPTAIGTLLADAVHEWAWQKGKNSFPKTYFSPSVDKAIFLKHLAADYLRELSTRSFDGTPTASEVALFKRVAPHAIITTNFDSFLEAQFPDYEVVVGEKIIPMSMSIMGELYKIHGTIDDPESMVLTSRDYDRFMQKRRYISSKMMTYFAEYPVFILGYGLGDRNVNSIISDLGEALKEKGGLLDNVCYVEWVPDVSQLATLKEEYVIPVGDGTLPPLRLHTIVTSDFTWVLQALADFASPVTVQTKLLRELAARVVDLVRTDAPQTKVEINYEHVEKLTKDKSELALILGISNVSNPNLHYPYLLTQIGQMLGFKGWHGAQKLLPEASKRVGYDIKASDNEYHMAVKTGVSSVTHKFSGSFAALLKTIVDEAASSQEAFALVEAATE